jgi:hypothetical protein
VIQQIEISAELQVVALEAAAVALRMPPVAAFVAPEAFAAVAAFAMLPAVFSAAGLPLAVAVKLPVV